MIVPTMIVDGGSKAKISTFVYNGVSYQFEVGMAWSDFVSSKYNTTGIFINGTYVLDGVYAVSYPCKNSNYFTNVGVSDFITNINYATGRYTAGGSD